MWKYSEKIIEKIAQKLEDISLTGPCSFSGHPQDLYATLLSSERCSEVVFILTVLPPAP